MKAARPAPTPALLRLAVVYFRMRTRRTLAVAARVDAYSASLARAKTERANV